MGQVAASAGTAPSTPRTSWFRGLVRSPFLWGGLTTFVFYWAIPYLPVWQEMTYRYFCSHWVEYATCALFFIGLAILAFKYLDLLTDKAIWKTEFVRQAGSLKQADDMQTASRMMQSVQKLPAPLHETVLVKRLQEVNRYIRTRMSADGLAEHLKYLGELAVERQYSSFAMIRTITWAIPILGFLGTVLGITIAIAYVTPEQLESSLNEVTAGLAVAFDTTALSLTLSLILVFATFLIERAEGAILDKTEEFGINTILGLFPGNPPEASLHPLMQAETEAARELISQTETLIQWQTQHWKQSLDELRHRWLQTLEAQQSSIESNLTTGMRETLEHHQQSLQDVRTEFVQTIQQLTHRLADSVEQSNQHSQNQLQEVRALTAQLQQIGGNEETLLRLQEQLTQNLEALRVADTFEETMHSLSAAVHLLSTRAKPVKAA